MAVKRLLEEYGLSSGSIKGTGRPNRLLKEDVLAHIKAKNLQKVAPKSGLYIIWTGSKIKFFLKTINVNYNFFLTVSAPSAAPSKSGVATKSTVTTSAPAWKGGPSTFSDEAVSNIRAVIAKRLGESKV